MTINNFWISWQQEINNNSFMFPLGVHCSHGFNRTGFLIVAYLVEKLNYDVNSAIAQFAAAR